MLICVNWVIDLASLKTFHFFFLMQSFVVLAVFCVIVLYDQVSPNEFGRVSS